MTIESTLTSLADEGRLVEWALSEGDDRQPERLLFLNPDLEDWLKETLFRLPRPSQVRRPRYDQVEDLFDRFVGDPTFNGTGDFVNIMPQSFGVYEIKTETVRVFGWFAARRCFVAAVADLKAKVKGKGYKQRREQTVPFRRSLNLPKPGFVRGHGNVSSLL